MNRNVEEAVRLLLESHATLATAESCTGGMLSAAITEIPGVSECFNGGIVSYSNQVKLHLLEVPEETLAKDGAVSAKCAMAMARGTREKLGADWGVSTTGIAGPSGGSAEKPVGLVYIGISSVNDTFAKKFVFSGDRAAIRRQSVEMAALLLAEAIEREISQGSSLKQTFDVLP